MSTNTRMRRQAALRNSPAPCPNISSKLTTAHVAHPGCFATATLLASVPLLALRLVAPTLFVAGVTGSTGSGRKPVEATHHPLRHGDLYAYGALHASACARDCRLCARAITGIEADFAFVPHSGPFARGIHVTVQAALQSRIDTARLLAALRISTPTPPSCASAIRRRA